MLIKDSSADEHNTSLKENLLLINIKTVEDLVISLSSWGGLSDLKLIFNSKLYERKGKFVN